MQAETLHRMGVLLSALFIFAGLAALVRALWPVFITPNWRMLRGSGPISALTVRYLARDSVHVTEHRLVRAFNLAYFTLAQKGPWNQAQLWTAFAEIYIVIYPVEPWHVTVNARRGTREARTVCVGQTLLGLLHELAHLAERQLENEANAAHLKWAERGIATAAMHYTNTLGEID